MSDLDKLLKLYLLQELGDNNSIGDVYTNKHNLFNNELFDQGEKIANVADKDIDKLTDSILNNYNYSKVSEPEIFDPSINKKIRDVKCDTDTNNCLTRESKKVLAFEYSVNPPPNCNDRILRLMSFMQIIINHCSKYKQKLFEYDLVLNNLDINRGTSLGNARERNEELKTIVNNIDNIDTFDDKLQTINDMLNGEMIEHVNNFKPIEQSFKNNSNFLVDNIKTHFDNDKKVLDALVTVQNAILNKTLSESIKRVNFIGISNMPDDNKLEMIDKLLKGREEVKLNLV